MPFCTLARSSRNPWLPMFSDISVECFVQRLEVPAKSVFSQHQHHAPSKQCYASSVCSGRCSGLTNSSGQGIRGFCDPECPYIDRHIVLLRGSKLFFASATARSQTVCFLVGFYLINPRLLQARRDSNICIYRTCNVHLYI